MRALLALIACASEPVLVEDFQLIADDGWGYQLYRQADHERVGLFSHDAGCSAPHYDALNALVADGERILAIDPSPQSDRPALAGLSLDFPVLVDDTGTIWPALGVSRANQLTWIDTETWTVIERIDLGEGCDLPAPESKELDYVTDIAPILAERCQVCHWKRGVAPFAMESYEQVLEDSPMIREVLRTRRMPPWNMDPLVGTWQHDLSMSAEERSAVIRWIEAGAPRGEGTDPLTQTAPQSRDGREPREDDGRSPYPDHWMTVDEQTIPATGLLPYRYFDLGTFENDIWVSGIKIDVTNRKVVHHACIILSPKGLDDYGGVSELRKAVHVDEDVERTHFWTPGKPSRKNFEEGHAFLLPAGHHLVLEIHYNPSGRVERDQPSVGLWEYEGEDTPKRMRVLHAQSRRFVIPSHAQDFQVVHEQTVEEDMLISAGNIHMHYRGRSGSLVATHPDGREEVVMSVPHYDFNWQRGYHMAEPILLEKGSTLTLTGRFDNSAFNPLNPEPTRWVPWGSQTPINEMFKAGVTYTTVE